MAVQYTRVYKYTKNLNKDGWLSNACSLALSDFAVSGETTIPITKIVSITANYYCNQTTSANVIFKFRLAIGETDYYSGTNTYSGSKLRNLTQSITTLPEGSLWVQENIQFKADVNYTTGSSARSKTTWQGSSEYPIVLTVVYESESLKPIISNPKLYRADTSGVAKNAGENLSLTATLSASMLGGTGTLKLYRAGVTDAIYTANISLVSNTSVDITVTPLTGDNTTQAIGTDCSYTLEFIYTDSGITETETASLLVPKTFVNVHLSSASTGGVRLGGYSQATNDSPMFECDYPIYGYNGFVNIQTGKTTQASHANGTEESVPFKLSFKAIPTVMICMDCSDSGSSFGGCFIAVKNVTVDGFTIRYANTSGSTRTYAVRWMAYSSSC